MQEGRDLVHKAVLTALRVPWVELCLDGHENGVREWVLLLTKRGLGLWGIKQECEAMGYPPGKPGMEAVQPKQVLEVLGRHQENRI